MPPSLADWMDIQEATRVSDRSKFSFSLPLLPTFHDDLSAVQSDELDAEAEKGNLFAVHRTTKSDRAAVEGIHTKIEN
jgi:hypothetical protein